jgi:hypothetical protein
VFGDRMDALCREIGGRGRADAVAVDTAPARGAVNSQLEKELHAMKVSALRKRAIASGASEAAVEEADDADDTKSEVIKLILVHERSDEAVKLDAIRAELLACKTSLLRRCEKRHFLYIRHLYIKNEHFTKTGSGQT